MEGKKQKKGVIRENDFEARCSECSKGLLIILKRMEGRALLLTPSECWEHPGKSHILWPQRDDIKEEN